MPRVKKSARLVRKKPVCKRARNTAPTTKKTKKPTKAKRRKFRRVPKTDTLSKMKVPQIKSKIRSHNKKVCIKLSGNK